LLSITTEEALKFSGAIMLRRTVLVFVTTALLISAASAEVVFFSNGKTIEGRLIDSDPDSEKVTVKTKYGSQEYRREQIVAMVSTSQARIVKTRLAAGKTYMRRNMMQEAVLEFEVVLKIDKNFQTIIDGYVEELALNAAEIERAFERYKPKPKPAPEPEVAAETETVEVEEPEPEPEPEKSFFSKLMSGNIKYVIGAGIVVGLVILLKKGKPKD
jgi:hypothetical protein